LYRYTETVIRYGTKSQVQLRRIIDKDEADNAPAARPRAKKEHAAAAAAAPGGAEGANKENARAAAAGADAGAEAAAKRVKREAAVTNNEAPVDLAGRFAGAAGADDGGGGVICLDD
jgi:hypothetical protein